MDILDFLNNIVSVQQVQALASLIVANFALGIIAAIRKKEFQLAKVKDIGGRAVTMFITYVVVAGAAKGMADVSWLRDVVWGALVAYMSTQLITNIRDITGLNIPDRIMNAIEKK